MTQQASEMVQREKASLWRMKQLLTKFRGDEIWAPCGHLQTENDVNLFGPMQTTITEQSISVHDGIEESLPIEQSSISNSTVQLGDTISQTSIPKQGSEPPVYSLQPLAGSGAILTENLRAGQQSPDPVQATLSALISGDADQNTPQDVILDYAYSSTDLQGKAAENELPAAEHSNVTPDVPRDSCMDGITEAENIRPEDKDAPTTATASSDSIDFSTQIPPPKVSDVTAVAGTAGPDSHSNDERKSAEPVPSTVKVAGHNSQLALSHVESPMDGNEMAGTSPETADAKHPDQPQAEGREQGEEGEFSQPAQHRMTTRAQAQAASDNTTASPTRSPSPAVSISTFVHPFFLVPASAHPDRDFGLPPAEAEDTRRALMSYVQKQEEVCRGVGKLYEGLLRADRMRKTVLQWCKAEEHVGEMSDGEDWYDKEEWALDEDLKKGHDEEEDEGGNQGKKTRGRRT